MLKRVSVLMTQHYNLPPEEKLDPFRYEKSERPAQVTSLDPVKSLCILPTVNNGCFKLSFFKEISSRK